MFKNYFKTAWRNLVKNKFYSFINISGITIGLTVGLLILLWVQDELSYDRFHKQSANIIKLENMVGTGVNRQLWSITTAPIAPMAKKTIPGVEDYVRITSNNTFNAFRYQGKLFNEQQSYFVDPSFFSVFDFNLVVGNSSNPFPDDHSIVITEATAKRYFNNEEAIGKLISAGDTVSFKVTGVIKDFPHNSSIQGNMFFPISLLAKLRYTGSTDGKTIDNDFVQFDYDTYILLKPAFAFNGFAKRLRALHLSVKPDDTDIGYVWLPLSKIHLFHADGTEGGMSTIRMFMIIGIVILIIASINYINLSTARSTLRVKEVSLRKIVGAVRLQLFFQFIVETSVLFIWAIAASLLLVYLLVPLFNQLCGKELTLHLDNFGLWKVLLCTITGTLIVSSIYPAFLLSSFQPLNALKGKISGSISNSLFRRVLVVLQFSFSIVLIAATIIIGRQLSYMRSKQLGYNKENVVTLNLINMPRHLDAIRADMLKQPGVLDVTWASMNLINYGGQTGDNSWDGKETGETMMLSPMNVQKDFIPFFKMQLTEGSNFSGTPADSMHFILNETAVRAARLTSHVGKKFKLWNTEGTIIGVVKDFHFLSMRHKIMPAIFYSQQNTYGYLYIKTTGKDLPGVINAAHAEWSRYNADFPFEYHFLDQDFEHLYASEQRSGVLYTVFAGIAIAISCLGLLGLAAYTAQVRTKEIGVRKVLGASVHSVVRLLAKDFLKLVLIAVFIATPVAWFIMNKWLEEFSYRTNIGWDAFFIAGALGVGIALLTISFQTVRAAFANPAKSLRTD